MSPVPCWVVAAGWVVLLDCCCATLWSPDLTRHRCCDVTNHLPTHTTAAVKTSAAANIQIYRSSFPPTPTLS